MGIIVKAEPRLVEVANIPVIYVDESGRVEVEGNNLRITYIEYRTFGTERVRVPAVEIIRPLVSLRPERLNRMIADAMRLGESASTH
jgi:hypothetical protein